MCGCTVKYLYRFTCCLILYCNSYIDIDIHKMYNLYRVLIDNSHYFKMFCYHLVPSYIFYENLRFIFYHLLSRWTTYLFLNGQSVILILLSKIIIHKEYGTWIRSVFINKNFNSCDWRSVVDSSVSQISTHCYSSL